MIEVKNLTKRYGKIVALDDISFTVEKGEILGFLGPNGAGKSTTMNIITGYISSTSGSVKVDGHDILEEPEKVKKKIGYLPEQPPLYMDMTVLEYLKFVGELKEVPKDKLKNQLDDIMELTRVSNVRGRVIKNLSKGYRQRVGLAQALVGRPDVLILDEPTVGLDPEQINETRKLIKALAKHHTIMFSSHILSEVSAVCNRIVIIKKGRIAAIDTTENLSKGFEEKTRLVITAEGDANGIKAALEQMQGVEKVVITGEVEGGAHNFEVETKKDLDIRRNVFGALSPKGYTVLEMKSQSMSLEEVFLQVTGDDEIVGGDEIDESNI